MASIAPHVGAWLQRPGGWASPAAASGAAVTHPVVELFIAEQWVDITSYVYYRDMITITRGRLAEGGQTDPGTCRLTVNNRDGRFSPRNPTGPYYGQLGRNTPLRVSVVRNGISRYRFHGEVSAWPVRWDTSGSDVWVEVEASGLLRRLRQGSSPLRSALVREYTNPARTHIVGYWPMEDAAGAASLASAFDGHQPATISGTPTLAVYTDWAGSEALPTMGTATFSAIVPGYTSTSEVSVRCLVYVPAAGVSTTQKLLDVSTTGTARRWVVSLTSTGGMGLDVYDVGGTVIESSGPFAFGLNGTLFALQLDIYQSGSDIEYEYLTYDYTNATLTTADVTATSGFGTVVGYTVNAATSVRIGTDGGLGDVSVGHLAVADDFLAYGGSGSAILGWRGGETPTERAFRLCREEEISFQDRSGGDTGNTVLMGAQGATTLSDLFQECADTDDGILIEPRDEIGVAFRSRTSLYQQDAALTLDYAQYQLSGSLEPVDDDRSTVNDITVTRSGGSSARQVLETGALSVQAPPDGVGRYGTSVTINPSSDASLPDHAGWRLHKGTVDEARYPQISINLRHSTFTDDAGMMGAALVLDVGDRIVVSNPPAWLPPDDITQIVDGYTETLGVLEHDITLNCSPESPYHVAVLDAATARLDTAGSELASAVSSSATSLSVLTTSGPVWVNSSDYAAEFPFDVKLGGEVVTVTAINPPAEDAFTRSETATWGTADTGGAWTEQGGVASDRSVNGSAGVITLQANPSTIRTQSLLTGVMDCDIRVSISPDQLATGDSFLPGILMRYVNVNNYYRVRLVLTTTGVVQLALTRAGTLIGSTVSTGLTYTAGSTLWLLTRIRGNRVRARVGVNAVTEFDGWQLDETITGDVITSGGVGVSGSAFSGNTNVSPAFSYDNFEVMAPQTFTVTRSVNGVTKAHNAGAAVSLADPVVLAL